MKNKVQAQIDPAPSTEVSFRGTVEAVDLSTGQANVLPRQDWVVRVRVDAVHSGVLKLRQVSFRVHSPTKGLGGTPIEEGATYDFFVQPVAEGYQVTRCTPVAYEGLEETSIQVGQKLRRITREDLVQIRDALRAKVEDHPDRLHLRGITKDAGTFITDDGVAHVGAFVLGSDGENLSLEYVPLPVDRIQDTFGFAAVVDRVNGAWVVLRLDTVHHRWR